jgi:uncharacterized protein
MRRVAIIGSGIAGLGAAYHLRQHARVSLFEADNWFGGHAHTVDLTLEGTTHGVDTGFLVFNHRTYPLLQQLFAELGVDTAASEMSFSVQARSLGLEWSGTSLNGVFAQRRNLVKPSFLLMLADILRFNRLATQLAQQGIDAALHESLGDFLQRERFGTSFREGYLLPMLGCIWSCPTTQMLQFPVATMIRFCHNHGLLQVSNRPQWYTVTGGSRQYVQRLLAQLHAHDVQTRLSEPVLEVRRASSTGTPLGAVSVRTRAGMEVFDEVVFACHSDQALALLGDVTPAEHQVLSAVRYQANVAVLHTDSAVLPTRRAAWASWNYDRQGLMGAGADGSQVCLHYLLNRLQPLPWQSPVVVSLNPHQDIPADKLHGVWHYSHPVFDLDASRAQRRLPHIQGRWHTWFAGAWTGYGFHEDGLRSAATVAQTMLEHWSNAAPGRSGSATASAAAAPAGSDELSRAA